MPKPVCIQAACAENRVIGRDGRLPWHIPEDTRQFHATTAGQIVLLSRVSYENWPDVTAEGRRAIVVTRRGLPAVPEGVWQRPGLAEALDLADVLPGAIHLCGGEKLYEEGLALDRPLQLRLTLVHAVVDGDRKFPDWRHLPWREVNRRESSDANFRYTFLTLEKVATPGNPLGPKA